MVHFVISEVDRGEAVVIRKIKCKTPETLGELKDRISLPSPPPSLYAKEHSIILEGRQMAIHGSLGEEEEQECLIFWASF